MRDDSITWWGNLNQEGLLEGPGGGGGGPDCLAPPACCRGGTTRDAALPGSNGRPPETGASHCGFLKLPEAASFYLEDPLLGGRLPPPPEGALAP